MSNSVIQKMIDDGLLDGKNVVTINEEEIKPSYSKIQNGVLVSFDERDLNENGEYVTPANVKVLGSNCFGSCEKLRKVIISEGVVCIESLAFRNCINLESIVFPKSLKRAKHAAFVWCLGLKEVDMHSTQLVEITPYFFSGCENLQAVILPQRLESIGSYAFNECYKLNEITMPNTLKDVADDAFEECAIGPNFMKKFNQNKTIKNNTI